MAVGTDTITIYRGEDLLLQFDHSSSGEDITGWTIEFNVKGSVGVLFTIAAVITNALGGLYEFTVTDDETDALIPGEYTYDVWRTDAGSERVMALGVFKVIDVARDVTT